MKDLDGVFKEYLLKDRKNRFTWRGSPVFMERLYSGLVDFVKSIKDTDQKTILEIGVLFGESTELFSKCFKKVFSIDPFNYDVKVFWNGWNGSMKDVEAEFLKVLSSTDNVEHVKEYSYNANNKFENESIDVLYVDGDHSYSAVKKDLELFCPKVKKQGIIAGHDYANDMPEVVSAVNDFFGRIPDIVFSDSSWIINVD